MIPEAKNVRKTPVVMLVGYIRLRQSNRPYCIFVYPKIRICTHAIYRVDEYMEIRIDRQAHLRLCVHLNIHNFT